MTFPAAGGKMAGMERTRTDFPRTWEEVCNNPLLADLPYRVEINREGNIVLSPHTNRHSEYQATIQRLLDRLMKGGFAAQEYAITAKNSTPVPDVVWISRERRAATRGQVATNLAPEICIEVRSPSDTRREMGESGRNTSMLERWNAGFAT